MTLTLDHFKYDLPPERIAHLPAEPRDSSRLLAVDRASGQLSHYHFRDLPTLLQPGDVLIRNNTKVIPARLLGQKESGGPVELLLTKRLHQTNQGEVWECLTKPGLKLHQTVHFPHYSPLTATCTAVTGYTREITFNQTGAALFASLIEIGHTPVPPYIHWQDTDEAILRQKYQTIYAKIQGSAAAPTAGLHFTPELDQRLWERGIDIAEVTLHVGLGTFLRVKESDITQHHMHSEYFELSATVADQLNQAKQAGRRMITVGTTTTRVLETCATEAGLLTAQAGDTNIFIYPPYQFKFVEHLITNFHESQSTLLMLVSAFASSPNTTHPFSTFADTVMGRAYQEAIAQKYRLLSFGDAMLIW